MGFFSKRKEENNGFIINTDDEPIKITGDKNLAPHAFTADEVSGLWVFNDENQQYQNNNALDALKKRMSTPETSKNDTNKANDKVKAETTTVYLKPETDTKEKTEETVETKAEVKPEIKNEVKTDNVIAKKPEEQPTKVAPAIVIPKKSLVEKVKRYTIDEQGHNVTETQKPLYELESVAEILKNNSENAMKNLSKKYGLDFVVEDLGKNQTPAPPVVEEKKAEFIPPKNMTNVTPTPAFEQMVNDAEARENRKLYENLFQQEKPKEMPDISVPDISDIDTKEVGISSEPPISNTATIRFTPVKDHKGNTDHITISSVTKHIDLGDNVPEDISSHSAPQLEHTDFDDFEPQNEYIDNQSGKKILLSLAKKKRSCFLGAIFSFLVIIVLSAFFIPSMRNLRLYNSQSAMITCTAFLFISVLSNANMFVDFKNLTTKRASFDIIAALYSLLALSLGLVSAFTSHDSFLLMFLCAIMLFVRALFKFRATSAKHASLKKIVNDNPKNAVTLINDPATTFAMAKHAIEGDILVAAHKKTRFVENFMKHYDYHATMAGKVSIVFYVTLALALTCGMITFFLENDIYNAMVAATSVVSIAAIPTAFLIDNLPLSSAAKKLNGKGAMIAGIYAAEKIENANAAVINVNDIFQKGTITLHDMKVLSNNNIDAILLRAASLTKAVGSPLNPIFEEIAGTNTSYSIPDSDTVKYEKNLGISGWVDNEPMFIGNRSLMQAHGIEIPSLEVDKKILRQGYFPVYVATSNTACALIIIQYDVDAAVAKELHKITDLGVLLLVENCDPNVNEAMLCDYFDLYEDSVKVMSNAGLHMYKNAVPDTQSCSSPAIFRGTGLNFIKIVNCATNINKCNRILTVLYSIFAIFGALYFVYAAFSGAKSMPDAELISLYALGTTVLSIIGFLIRKP